MMEIDEAERKEEKVVPTRAVKDVSVGLGGSVVLHKASTSARKLKKAIGAESGQRVSFGSINVRAPQHHMVWSVQELFYRILDYCWESPEISYNLCQGLDSLMFGMTVYYVLMPSGARRRVVMEEWGDKPSADFMSTWVNYQACHLKVGTFLNRTKPPSRVRSNYFYWWGEMGRRYSADSCRLIGLAIAGMNSINRHNALNHTPWLTVSDDERDAHIDRCHPSKNTASAVWERLAIHLNRGEYDERSFMAKLAAMIHVYPFSFISQDGNIYECISL